MYAARNVFWLGVIATVCGAFPPTVVAQDGEDNFTWNKQEMEVVAPLPGYDEVPLIKPSWCKGVTHERKQPKGNVAAQIRRRLKATVQRGFTAKNTSRLLRDFCRYKDDPGFQAQAGYMVQLWVNQTGQSKDDAIRSMVARLDIDQWNKDMIEGCKKWQVPNDAPPEEEEIATSRLVLFGCGNIPFYLFRQTFSKNYEWHIDRTDVPPTELDRVAHALQCLPLARADGTWKEPDWVGIGMCGNDIRALDRKKLERETKKMSAPFRAIAVESYARAKAILADLERSLEEKAGADSDYQKLLYDAPSNAWENWVKGYKKHRRAIDATFAFEEDLFSRNRKAYAACARKLEPGMRKFVKRGKFRTREAFLEAMQGPFGSIIVNALGACYAVTSPAKVGELLLDINKDKRIWRGPRSAVRHAMIDVLNDIRAKREGFPIAFTHFETVNTNIIRWQATTSSRSRIPTSGNRNETVSGVVKNVKRQGRQLVRAGFKAASWSEPSYRCEETKRVDFMIHGKLHYARECSESGNAERTFKPNTTTFLRWAAKGIRPNAFVVMRVPADTQDSPEPRQGHPIEVYTNAERTKLVNMYGFGL